MRQSSACLSLGNLGMKREFVRAAQSAIRTLLVSAITALWILLHNAAVAAPVSETFTNPDGTVFTTIVDADDNLVRYEFDFSPLPYSYEQISIALPDGTAVVFWVSAIHPDNPTSPFSTGFIINDDSGLQMEYQTATNPPTVNWIEFHYRPEFFFASLVLPDIDEENIQVTFREPAEGFPPEQEDNIKLRAFAPQFMLTSGPGAVASFVMDKTVGPLQLNLSWGPSCSASAADYAIYEGTLASLHAGSYDHVPILCSDLAPLLQETIIPATGSTYYLAVPLDSSAEGSYGTRTEGADLVERPIGTPQCVTDQQLGCP